MTLTCFRSEAEELLNFPDRPAWTLPQSRSLQKRCSLRIYCDVHFLTILTTAQMRPVYLKLLLLKTQYSKYLWPQNTFKSSSVLILVCGVFPSSDCFSFPLDGDSLWLWGCYPREDVLFIQCRGWCIISLEHRVAFHMDFPCALRLFGLQSSLPRAVNTALCLCVFVWLLCHGLCGCHPVSRPVLQTSPGWLGFILPQYPESSLSCFQAVLNQFCSLLLTYLTPHY